MVKFYTSNFTYDYPFPTVSLAYFLRYPNPYATHVLSTDVIERSFDAAAGTLTTTRLHLKRSKLPSAILKVLPSSLLGASAYADGEGQSYILERSIVDVKKGRMRTESRNLEFTGILNVVEEQVFEREQPQSPPQIQQQPDTLNPSGPVVPCDQEDAVQSWATGRTGVTTTVTMHSPLGERRRRQKKSIDEREKEPGFFRSWSTASLQRSIELIGLRRAERSQPNAKEGMKVVMRRLRQGGLVAVLEGMRNDRELAFQKK